VKWRWTCGWRARNAYDGGLVGRLAVEDAVDPARDGLIGESVSRNATNAALV
jgi:hypothetical protein